MRTMCPRAIASPVIGSALLCLGCLQIATGSVYQDSHRFAHRPERNYQTKPIQRIDETYYGLNVLGVSVRPLEPETLQPKSLENPRHYVTNWQVLVGTLDLPYLDLLLTVPYARVIFDVVDVEEVEP